MRDTVRLGRIFGVPVGLNWSLLAITGLFAFGLAQNRFPYDAPGDAGGLYALAGCATAVALLVSVLLHELGHALVARRAGMDVDGITLSWMGGVTRINGESVSPGRELSIAAIGPLVSLVLGGGLWGARALLSTLGADALLLAAVGWLAVINVALAIFNLIPASPLDGGRILHAGIWCVTRDRWKATRVAARAGILLAGLVLIVGVFDVLTGRDTLDAVLVLVLGWWLLSAARDEEVLANIQHVLGGVEVHELMRPVGVAPARLSTPEFVAGFARPHPGWVWLLDAGDGHYTGLLSGDAVLGGTSVWGAARPEELSVPITAAAATYPTEGVLNALERTGGRQILLAVEHGRTVGAVLPADIEAVLRTRSRAARLAAPPTR